MELSDKIIAVSKMQKYIDTHFEEKITLNDLSCAACYSKYHATRIFKELTGKTPFESIRALRLTKAAQTLRDSGDKVVNVAFDNGFESHDGFTRAFARQFEITPQKYSSENPAINYFIHHPIEAYYTLKDGADPVSNEKVSRTVTVTVVERPARKLIFYAIRQAIIFLLVRKSAVTGRDFTIASLKNSTLPQEDACQKS